MKYKLVVLDLDGTVWDYAKTSSDLPEPIRVDGDRVTAGDGTTLRLRDGLRGFLAACAEKKVFVSVASWNNPTLPTKILEALGLIGYFIHPKLEPHPYKEVMIKSILDDLKKDGISISPEETVFVDDREVMVERVKQYFPPITALLFGVDVKSYAELNRLICG
ncbi:MAG: magnesium-dependent phosphatase-1 [Thermoprotei archaeon]